MDAAQETKTSNPEQAPAAEAGRDDRGTIWRRRPSLLVVLATVALLGGGISLLWASMSHKYNSGLEDLEKIIQIQSHYPDALIDPLEILDGGPGKDGIPALTNPKTIPAEEATYLKDDDRVIGVKFGLQARAYPLRILVWHENANDLVGGRPIAVTYCPLCDSSLVFDRNVGGQVREFGISGKLYRSNVLMFDRQPDAANESFWSQLQMRAVTGPAAKAGLKLKLLDSVVTTWGEWRALHPETTVLSIDTGHRRDYLGRAYASYFSNDRVGFGAHGNPERRPELNNKDRIVVAYAGGQRRIYVVRDVAAAASGASEPIQDTLGGVKLKITHLKEADSLRIEAAETDAEGRAPDVEVAYTYWFAWEELNPGVEIWSDK